MPDVNEARENLERTLGHNALNWRASVVHVTGELGILRQGCPKLMAHPQVDRRDPGRDRAAQTPSR